MIAARLASRVGQCSGGCTAQTQLLIDWRQEGRPTMTGDVSPAEISLDFAAFDGWKQERSAGTVCHGGLPCWLAVEILPSRFFRRFSIPFVQYPGYASQSRAVRNHRRHNWPPDMIDRIRWLCRRTQTSATLKCGRCCFRGAIGDEWTAPVHANRRLIAGDPIYHARGVL